MRRIIIGFLLCSLSLVVHGQPNLLSTVGLAHRDGTGRDWAYVVWQSPNSSAVAEQSFAVYTKAGTATSSNNYQRTAIVMRQQDTRVIDPLLARSVYYTTREQQVIREELYAAIATVLAFVLSLKRAEPLPRPVIVVPATMRFDSDGRPSPLANA